MSYRNDQTGLIAALFDEASGAAPGWSGFLTLLAAMTQATGAAFAGMETAGVLGDCPPLEAETLRQMRTDRLYAAESLPGPPPEARLRAVKVRVGRDAYAVLQIRRAAHERDFRSADALFLDGLVPFLGQAVAIRQAGDADRRRAALTDRLTEGLGAGWILFDRTGAILDLSSFAADWGERSGLRLSSRRRFEPADPDTALEFRQGMAACLGGQGAATVVVEGAPRAEMVLRPENSGSARAVLGLLRVAPQGAARDAGRIAAHLGLSRSEARLVAQLCDGETLRSAGANLGWTEETTRSTSKQVFARLGVAGQPGLLRRVLNGALWLR